MNTRNLKKRTHGWAVVYYVPVEDQGRTLPLSYNGPLGKPGGTIGREIVRGLGTRDLRLANRKKHIAMGEIAMELAELRGDIAPREQAKRLADQHDGSNISEDVIKTIADDIFDTFTNDNPTDQEVREYQEFIELATNKAIPVSMALERWMKVADGITNETAYQYGKDVKQFIEWADDPSVKAVTEDMAAKYFTHLMTAPTRNKSQIAPNTLHRKIGSLNRLWKWMKKRRVYRGKNPWSELLEQAPGEKKRGTVVKELNPMPLDRARSYMSAVKVSRSKYSSAGADILTLLWHTGIRPRDLAEFLVDQIEWDKVDNIFWLHVINGKNKNNERFMPVVSQECIAVIRRRIEGAKNGILFHDVEPGGPNNQRYWRLQKPLNAIRRKALKGEPVDTYSFRRAFSVACEEVGLDPVHHSRLMGHDAPTLAAAVYNRGNEGRARMHEGIKKVDKHLGELNEE